MGSKFERLIATTPTVLFCILTDTQGWFIVGRRRRRLVGLLLVGVVDAVHYVSYYLYLCVIVPNNIYICTYY